MGSTTVIMSVLDMVDTYHGGYGGYDGYGGYRGGGENPYEPPCMQMMSVRQP